MSADMGQVLLLLVPLLLLAGVFAGLLAGLLGVGGGIVVVPALFLIFGHLGVDAAVRLILDQLGLQTAHFSIFVDSRLPRGMGLGSSAALAVAFIRGICDASGLSISNERINTIAFECEKLAHGTPSGVDNTLSTFAKPMLFCNDGRLRIEPLELAENPPLIIAYGDEAGLTSEQVAGVRARRDRSPERYDAIFDEMDRISLAAMDLLLSRSYQELGLAMNVCHGLLLSLIHISEPTRLDLASRMPSYA